MEYYEDSTGYMVCYAPDHPCANGAGKVTQHKVVVWEHTGVVVTKGWCIHHKDRNKKNNSIENLLVLTDAEHLALHWREDGGTVHKVCVCPVCNEEFSTTEAENFKYCGLACFHVGQRKFEVSKSTLETMVQSMPITKIAKIYSVSDSAVIKRCEKLGVKRPGRGYWAKQNAGKHKVCVASLPSCAV